MASNTFIYKHYEKVILAGLLLLFSGLLYLQLSVVQKSQGKKVDDIVNAKEPPADFVKTDYSAAEFNNENLFDKEKIKWGKLWKEENPYKGDKNAETVDMMVPVKMGLCKNYHGAGGRMHLIPISCFPPVGSDKQEKCTFDGCGIALDAPKKETADVVNQEKEATDDDTNKNGIPDEWEKEHNIFNEYIEGQEIVIADTDGDGFNDKEEYDAKTHPCDIKSHPAFVTKLVLDQDKAPQNVAFDEFLDQKKCGKINDFVFESKIGSKKAKFRYKNENGKFSRLPTSEIGKEILFRSRSSNDKELPSIGFVLTKIDSEEVENKDGVKKKVDYVVINSVAKDKAGKPIHSFKCYANQPIVTGHLRVFVLNTLDNKNFGVRLYDKIKLGTEENGIEEYTVTKISGTGKDTVVVLTDAKGVETTLRYPAEEETEKVKDGAAE